MTKFQLGMVSVLLTTVALEINFRERKVRYYASCISHVCRKFGDIQE
jgi:hypothetical protein